MNTFKGLGPVLAALVVAVMGLGQMASAGSLTATTAHNTYAPEGYAGGAFQSKGGTTLQTDQSSSGGVFARDVFYSTPGNDPLGLPSGDVRFAGIFEFDYSNMVGFSDITSDPSQDYRYDFSWDLTFNSGEGETTTNAFSGSVVANYHQMDAGWVSDGNGNWFAAILYPKGEDHGEGIFAWATEAPAGSWWSDLDGGDGRYASDQPNSAYIEMGGTLSINAAVVPTPSAALAGFALMGIVGLRRQR